MTDDSRFLSLVTQVLDQPPTKAPDRLLSSVLDGVRRTPQRRSWWPARRLTDMQGLARFAIGAAVVLVVAIVGFSLLQPPSTSEPGNASPSAVASMSAAGSASPAPVASPTVVASPSAVASPSDAPLPSPSPARLETPAPSYPSLPSLRLPGTGGGAAGEYGWESGVGLKAGMHRDIGDSETAMTFAAGEGCLGASQAQQVPVRVAGFDGVSVEPYEPPVTFGRQDNAVTRAYKLSIGDRRLCVFVTWDPTTTADHRASALRTLGTLRAQPVGDDDIRITFMLDGGWDTG